MPTTDRTLLRRRPWVAPAILLLLLVPLLLKQGVWPVTWADLSPLSRTEASRVVFGQRLPRLVIGLVVGAALSVAGALMQALTRNPLAGPSLMGLGPGAAVGMLLAVLHGQPGAVGLAVASFAGAAVGAALVFAIASAAPRGATPERLVLTGAVVSSLLTATTGVIVFRLHLAEMFWFWTAGGIGPTSWRQVLTVLPMLGAGGLLGIAVSRPLSLLGAGDDTARTLGLDVSLVRGQASLAVLLLAGGAVAAAGPVAFVGVIVPNLCRPWAGADVRRLLSLSAVGGALLIACADAVVRHDPGSFFDLPLGAVTGLLGAPMMVVLARRGLRSL